jgi:hypothetical protein
VLFTTEIKGIFTFYRDVDCFFQMSEEQMSYMARIKSHGSIAEAVAWVSVTPRTADSNLFVST